MSYTVLARKWRPRTFAEMAGQEHVLRALINALDNDRLHHAFLFSGTRGVGKTTIARILAKCINCEVAVSSTPCGECSACIAIDEGRFVDLIEVDAASRTKVDDTRDLLDNVQYLPTVGRFKVYLIDEVHMLSRHSFNALLKTLEEPPSYVKFLLATTDPQRLPATVLSRCLQFNLKRLSRDTIATRLDAICKAEKFAADTTALELLARGADGSMRDGLSLLDQAVAYGGGDINEADVRAMLGTVERNKVFELATSIANRKGKEVLDLVAVMDEYAPDYSEVLQELALLLQRSAILALTKVAPRDSAEMADTARHLCQSLGSEELQLLYQIAIIGRRDLPLAPDARSGFEMVLLRMLAFLPAQVTASGSGGENQEPDTDARHKSDTKQKKSGVNKSASQHGHKVATNPPGQAAGQAKEQAEQGVESAPQSARKTSAAGITPQSGIDFSNWGSVIDVMSLQGAARQLAANCVVVSFDERQITLCLEHDNQHMFTRQVHKKLEAVMQNHLGDEYQVNIELGKIDETTPAEHSKALEANDRQSIRDSLVNDPNVQALVETFDAVIQEESIKPIN